MKVHTVGSVPSRGRSRPHGVVARTAHDVNVGLRLS
jgi:hypothetical protein